MNRNALRQHHAIQNAIGDFLKKGEKYKEFLFQRFGETMTVTHGLHTTPKDSANPNGYPHFNALDLRDKIVHVYCKPHYRNFNYVVSIFSFSKIHVMNVSDI
jgi:hypothetical protein